MLAGSNTGSDGAAFMRRDLVAWKEGGERSSLRNEGSERPGWTLIVHDKGSCSSHLFCKDISQPRYMLVFSMPLCISSLPPSFHVVRDSWPSLYLFVSGIEPSYI